MAKTKPTKPVGDGTVSFEFKLDQKSIASSYAKQVAKVAATAELKGFRKGKAPLNLVEKSLDKSKIYSYVLDDLIPPVYVSHLKAQNLMPLSEPRITPISMEEGKDWSFKAEIAVKPEFELGDYQKLVKEAKKTHAKAHKEDPKETAEHKRNHQIQVIFDALLGSLQFPVSSILVEDEAKSALSRLVNQLSSLKLSVADYAKSIKKSEKELVDEYQKTALDNLRLEFIMQKIVEDLKPEVTEEEVNKLKLTKDQVAYARYLVGKQKALDFLTAL